MANVCSYELEVVGQVATVRFTNPASVVHPDVLGDIHQELGIVLDELRWDDAVRIIVLTGKEDGYFQSILGRDAYEMAETQGYIDEVIERWGQGNGATRTNQALAFMEKPVIAMVNGDVSGFGQSVLFACDIIIAWEDAQITDGHLAMGQIRQRDGSLLGAPFGMVPGDGALAWLPSLMPATKAKEYLMLSKVYSARELADMNIVNYAVPMSELKSVTDDIVRRLLERPAREIAYTKRVMNKHLLTQLNLALDAGEAYQKFGLSQLGKRQYQNKLRLDT